VGRQIERVAPPSCLCCGAFWVFFEATPLLFRVSFTEVLVGCPPWPLPRLPRICFLLRAFAFFFFFFTDHSESRNSASPAPRESPFDSFLRQDLFIIHPRRFSPDSRPPPMRGAIFPGLSRSDDSERQIPLFLRRIDFFFFCLNCGPQAAKSPILGRVAYRLWVKSAEPPRNQKVIKSPLVLSPCRTSHMWRDASTPDAPKTLLPRSMPPFLFAVAPRIPPIASPSMSSFLVYKLGFHGLDFPAISSRLLAPSCAMQGSPDLRLFFPGCGCPKIRG